ncbi:hypothetical protein B0H10DRAFT_1943193 [Mycena sp. CBHHK59/15]|nr:hypothetical protein B0H10DRAFT_1943193 [Mycena sp. CBHHK59/15]
MVPIQNTRALFNSVPESPIVLYTSLTSSRYSQWVHLQARDAEELWETYLEPIIIPIFTRTIVQQFFAEYNQKIGMLHHTTYSSWFSFPHANHIGRRLPLMDYYDDEAEPSVSIAAGTSSTISSTSSQTICLAQAPRWLSSSQSDSTDRDKLLDDEFRL